MRPVPKKEPSPSDSIPIIALTGHVLGDSRRRAREAGVEEFLAKPCLPQDLAEAIKRLLPQR